jgi:hypothetical protein
MEKRIEETEKIGVIYKNLLSDLPADLDNYRAIISRTKDESIIELKNQQEETRRKLAEAEKRNAEAEKRIKESGNSNEFITRHLRVLKKMMMSQGKFRSDSDLLSIIEFGQRTVEESISLILCSNTLEEFISKYGYELTITDDQSSIKIIFHKKPKQFDKGMLSAKIGDRWYAIIDNNLYVNENVLHDLKAEFHSVKN